MHDTGNLAALVAGCAFALAFVFGALAHRVSLCTMGAIADIVNFGDWQRMRMWILAIRGTRGVPARTAAAVDRSIADRHVRHRGCSRHAGRRRRDGPRNAYVPLGRIRFDRGPDQPRRGRRADGLRRRHRAGLHDRSGLDRHFDARGGFVHSARFDVTGCVVALRYQMWRIERGEAATMPQLQATSGARDRHPSPVA